MIDFQYISYGCSMFLQIIILLSGVGIIMECVENSYINFIVKFSIRISGIVAIIGSALVIFSLNINNIIPVWLLGLQLLFLIPYLTVYVILYYGAAATRVFAGVSEG